MPEPKISTNGSSYDTTATLDETGHVVWIHWCRGERVEATLPNTGWRVIRAEPLTVEPSVSCDRCGWHGTITDGQPWPIHAAVLPGSSGVAVKP